MPEPVVVAAPAPPPPPAAAPPVRRGKLVKPKPLKKEPPLKIAQEEQAREAPSWVGRRSRPQSVPVTPVSEDGARERDPPSTAVHARFGKAAKKRAPPAVAADADAPQRLIGSSVLVREGSRRTRAESTGSSFVVLPEPYLPGPDPAPWTESPVPIVTVIPPSIAPPQFSAPPPPQSTPPQSSLAPSIHSLAASSQHSQPAHPSVTPPKNMDKIDELDESDPYGMSWHHSSPYEAIGSALGTGSRTGSAVGSNQVSFPLPALRILALTLRRAP